MRWRSCSATVKLIFHILFWSSYKCENYNSCIISYVSNDTHCSRSNIVLLWFKYSVLSPNSCSLNVSMIIIVQTALWYILAIAILQRFGDMHYFIHPYDKLQHIHHIIGVMPIWFNNNLPRTMIYCMEPWILIYNWKVSVITGIAWQNKMGHFSTFYMLLNRFRVSLLEFGRSQIIWGM